MECEIPEITKLIEESINDLNSKLNYKSYVLDVLVTRNKDTNDIDKCTLVEINPYHKSTSAIQYSWKELDSINIKSKNYGDSQIRLASKK